MQVLPLLLLTLLGGQQVLDEFGYANPAALRAAWKANEETPPVDLARDVDRPAMRFDAAFASQPKLQRVVADRRGRLDLSAAGGFVLEAAIDEPATVGGVSLYFHSGGGWYAANKPVQKKGWRSLRFPKALFSVEGTPDGWAKIDSVRLCAWRSPGGVVRDTSVRFRRLAAVWHDVALLVPSPNGSRTVVELAAGREAAHNLGAMLDQLGVGCDPLEEAVVSAETLGQRRIVAIPSNFVPTDGCVTALRRFVAAGGKLVIYSSATVHPRLRDALKLEDDPNSAVQVNGRGAIFDYDIHADNREAKNQLAEALGRLLPPLWKEIVQAELDRAGNVGPYETFAEALAGIKANTAEAARFLRQARIERQAARCADLFVEGSEGHAEAIKHAQSAHDHLVTAYLMSADSPLPEGRAVWNHSGTGAFPGDWDRSARLLRANGFNIIFPNMLWGGLAHYPSDVLPRSVTFRKYGDQIQQCCAAAKRCGIEVHVWKVNFNLLTAPKEFVDKLRSEGRTQVSVAGEPIDWLCPSDPDNRKLELDSLLEVLRKYPVDGLHLDYIRYPGREYCYCDGCRRRFEAASGRKLADADWPKECHSGSRKDEYNQWRCRQITELVAAVSREAKRVRPGAKISAAVFGAYPACRESVAQDWPAWVKAGYLDFVCPMDYSADDAEFASLVRGQVGLTAGRVPLYVGVGATATGIRLTPDEVVNQITLARSLGANGFSIFDLGPQTAAAIVPSVGLGAGSRPAPPPHRGK